MRGALADGGRFVAENGVKKRDCNFLSRTLQEYFFIFVHEKSVEGKKGTKVAKLGRTSYPNEAP